MSVIQRPAVNQDPFRQIVQTVRITVHNTGQLQNSQCSDNHSSIYFLLQEGRAVQLNMRTEPGYIDGVYEITARQYQQSQSAIRQFDYRPAVAFTPGQVDELLKDEDFDEYTFTNGGIGCRYWW